MLPETVYTADLLGIVPMRDYIRKNLQNWYTFVRDVKGWDVKNGDIRVVHSCRKSSGYGIATVSNGSTDPTTELTFSVQDSDESRCRYRWSHRGCATVKAGPSTSSGSIQPANQCLFVGTIDFKLGDEQWRSIENGDVPTFSCRQEQSNESPAPSHHRRGAKNELFDTSGRLKTATSNYPGSRRSSCDSAQFSGHEVYSTRPSVSLNLMSITSHHFPIHHNFTYHASCRDLYLPIFWPMS
jgi:hypothetical protein